jgi:hypothetical protein
MTTRRTSSFGLLLALLALTAQLTFGLPLPKAGTEASLAAATTLCHVDGEDTGGQVPAAPHLPDCLICPLCVAIASAAALLPADGAMVPAPPSAIIARAAVPPPATAPPPMPRFAAQPRAPPLQA